MSVAFLAAMTTTIYNESAHAKTHVSIMKDTPMAPSDITLSCRPSRVENSLQFDYSVANLSASDIYLLDGFPRVDPTTHEASIDPNGAYVTALEGRAAFVLKGIPPLPRNPVTVRIIPLGSKIAAGETLERTLVLPMPLAEQSPYFGELPLRNYEQYDISRVIVGVQILRSTKEGFAAGQADFASGYFRVQTLKTVHDAETLTCEFPTKSLILLKRKDGFVRIGYGG